MYVISIEKLENDLYFFCTLAVLDLAYAVSDMSGILQGVVLQC